MPRIVSNTGQFIQNTSSWVLSNRYNTGDICIYAGGMYRANDLIPENTPFTPGTTGATWTLVFQGGTNTTIVQVTTVGMATALFRFSDGTVWGAASRDGTGPYVWPGIAQWSASSVGSNSGLTNMSQIVFADTTATQNIPETSPCTWIGTQGGTGYALMANGKLYAWGYNSQGQLGLGDTTYRGIPSVIATDVAEVYTHPSGNDRQDQGYHRTIIRKTDGKIYGCGYNQFGALGIGSATVNVTSFVELTWAGTNPRSVWNLGAIAGNVIVNRDLGNGFYQIWGAGFNSGPTLGGGTSGGTLTAINVTNAWTGSTGGSSTTFIRDVSGGFGVNLNDNGSAIVMWLSDGTVRTTGDNRWGVVGNGTFTNNYGTPYVVNMTGTPKQISYVGGGSAAAVFVLMTSGLLYCWGRNNEGNLGNGNATNQSLPILPFATTDPIREILLPSVRPYANAWNSVNYIRKNDGSYWAAGQNGFGGKGDGTTITSNTWTRIRIKSTVNWSVMGGMIPWIDSSLVPIMVDTDGNIWAWGNNSNFTFTGMNNQHVLAPTRINPNYL